MELLQIICVLGALVIIVSRTERWYVNNFKNKTKEAAEEGRFLRIAIEGTQQMTLSEASFFRGFGIPLAQLRDAKKFVVSPQDDVVPPDVEKCVQALYSEGNAVGSAVMEYAKLGKKLLDTEAIYFAMLQLNKLAPPQLITFIDRVR